MTTLDAFRPSEAQVQTGILHLLAAMRIKAWRSNAGMATRPKRGGGVYRIKLAPEGWPDITGQVGGRLLGIECKRPGERPTPTQVETMRQINADGGFSFWTDDIGTCQRTLQLAARGYRVVMDDRGDWRTTPPHEATKP